MSYGIRPWVEASRNGKKYKWLVSDNHLKEHWGTKFKSSFEKYRTVSDSYFRNTVRHLPACRAFVQHRHNAALPTRQICRGGGGLNVNTRLSSPAILQHAKRKTRTTPVLVPGRAMLQENGKAPADPQACFQGGVSQGVFRNPVMPFRATGLVEKIDERKMEWH